MSASSFIKRAGAVTAIAVTLTAAAAPNIAYARHSGGGAIALGIIGTMLAGAAIASAQPAYAAPPAYYYQPQGYDMAPAYDYGPPAGYYQPSPYGYYR